MLVNSQPHTPCLLARNTLMEPPERFELPTPTFVTLCSGPTELWRQRKSDDFVAMTVVGTKGIEPLPIG